MSKYQIFEKTVLALDSLDTQINYISKQNSKFLNGYKKRPHIRNKLILKLVQEHQKRKLQKQEAKNSVAKKSRINFSQKSNLAYLKQQHDLHNPDGRISSGVDQHQSRQRKVNIYIKCTFCNRNIHYFDLQKHQEKYCLDHPNLSINKALAGAPSKPTQ